MQVSGVPSRYCGKDCQRQAWKAGHKKECRIASKPAVKIPPPQTPTKPAIATSLKPAIQPPTPHHPVPGKVSMIYESPAMITSGTNKDKHCSIISYDASSSTYMAVLTEEPSSGDNGGMLMGAVKFIAPHHLRLEDEILDCMFRRIPSQLDFRRTFAMQCDYKEEQGLDTGSPPYFAPDTPWTSGKERMQANLFDAHAWVVDASTGEILHDSLLSAVPHLADTGACVHLAWEAPHHAEYDALIEGEREQVRKVMQAMQHDGLDARREIETVLRNLKQGIGHCFRTVALYLELGGKGRVCVGSVGIAYSFKKRDRVWWLYGNGAKKSAAWVAGTAHAELAMDEGGAIASNGKFYAYV